MGIGYQIKPIFCFTIEYVRTLEHNYNVGATFLENQAKYIESLDMVEAVHSEWFLNGDGSGSCMNCGKRMEIFYDEEGCMKFCPNCGAKMDGDGNG